MYSQRPILGGRGVAVPVAINRPATNFLITDTGFLVFRNLIGPLCNLNFFGEVVIILVDLFPVRFFLSGKVSAFVVYLFGHFLDSCGRLGSFFPHFFNGHRYYPLIQPAGKIDMKKPVDYPTGNVKKIKIYVANE